MKYTTLYKLELNYGEYLRHKLLPDSLLSDNIYVKYRIENY